MPFTRGSDAVGDVEQAVRREEDGDHSARRMVMPFIRAASKTVVSAGTRTDRPSRVMSIIPGGVRVAAILK